MRVGAAMRLAFFSESLLLFFIVRGFADEPQSHAEFLREMRESFPITRVWSINSCESKANDGDAKPTGEWAKTPQDTILFEKRWEVESGVA